MAARFRQTHLSCLNINFTLDYNGMVKPNDGKTVIQTAFHHPGFCGYLSNTFIQISYFPLRREIKKWQAYFSR